MVARTATRRSLGSRNLKLVEVEAVLAPTPNAPGKAEASEPLTLIDALLAEQRELTAVEEFARAHDRHEIREPHYKKLVPATAPAPGQQYAFEVDLDKCSGCKACVTACHSLNGLDDGEAWRETGTLVSHDWRRPFQQTITTACHHCVDPGCLNGCPVLAYEKDAVTGIVQHLDDQCIGCEYCVMMCPYDVPKYSERRGIVRKCDLCSQRLAAGEAPACVQACPSEAIRINVVEQAKVRGKFRPLFNNSIPKAAGGKVGKWESGKNALSHFLAFSLAHFPSENESGARNTFLQASPNPAITLPTTRFVSQRPLPTHLEAADAHELTPSKAHRSLTVLLVLSQLGVGLALMDAVTGGRSRALAVGAFVATVVAAIVGLLHLGQPLKAWRSFLGWRKSWFSREFVAFAVFLGALAAHIALLHPLSARLAALSGLAAVFCSAMIYVVTRRPFWNAPMTFGKFFGTTLLLGGAGALLLTRPALPGFTLAVILGTAIKLAAENRIFRFLVDEQSPHLTALNKSALLLAGQFGLLSRVRALCAVAGGIALPALMIIGIGSAFQTAPAAAAFALCLAGELIERHLFFVAEVAPKLPGDGAA